MSFFPQSHWVWCLARMMRDAKQRRVNEYIKDGSVVQKDFLAASSADLVALPYPHAVLRPFEDAFLENVKEQLLLLNAGFKETDLFRVNQTGELANIDHLPVEEKDRLWALTRLRNELYSQEFRDVIERVTGCDRLNDRVDCAANVYSQGCHLLCHDDCISSRRISYILYVSDEPAWSSADGGHLELYPQGTRSHIETTSGVPSRSIPPNFGTMVIFQVEGGTSMHSVQEVFCANKRRISIQGWFHSDCHPLGPSNATIAHLTSKVRSQGCIPDVSVGCRDRLTDWINPSYVRSNVEALSQAMFTLSSVSLQDFFLEERVLAHSLAQQCDALDSLGRWRAPSYTAGCSQGWTIVGPPHRQRYCLFAGQGDSRTKLGQAGKVLKGIATFLTGPEFIAWVETVCRVKVTGVTSQIRRFRPGLDYTVAQHRSGQRLYINWCTVSEPLAWEESGSMGGYHVFTDGDEDPDKARQEAEVYTADGQGGQVLSISPEPNQLTMVLCREETRVEFIRYVSCGAPGSRWDVNIEMDL